MWIGKYIWHKLSAKELYILNFQIAELFEHSQVYEKLSVLGHNAGMV